MVQSTAPTAPALVMYPGIPFMVSPYTSTISLLMLQHFLVQMGLSGMNAVSNQFNRQMLMPLYNSIAKCWCLCSTQPEYHSSSCANHSSHNMTPSAPTLPQVSPNASLSNTAMSSGAPLIYHDRLLKSYTGGTICQGDGRFLSMTVQTNASDLSSQVSPDLDKRFMSINDALHHLKNNFLWVVDYFANVSIPTCVSEFDQTA